jgi:glycosyltransferase involved in cell wall biosynthesis
MFLSKIRRLIERKSQVTPEAPKTALDILKESGKFNSEWYSAAYPEIASHPYWGKNLLTHYLTIGGFEGKNPTKWFDSAWYLQHYTDVNKAAINPLLHYVLYGKSENRFPNLQQLNNTVAKKSKKEKISALASYDQLQVKGLIEHLWGGHSISAVNELEKIYKNEKKPNKTRALALWNIIRWVYFLGNVKDAIKLTQTLKELDSSNTLVKERVLINAFSNFELNKHSKVISELKDYSKLHPTDSDGYFVLANCYLQNDQQRLKLINKAFEKAGLSTIQLIDETQPLTIHNIKGVKESAVYKQIKVSIIMPVYNAESCLETAVNSLLAQTWNNIEVIIVDDCSTDNTFALANQLSEKDHRVKVLQQASNSGAYPARNLGLLHATGDFITTHDSDDWSHPQKIEKQLQYFEQDPQLLGLCTYWIRVKKNLFFTQNWRPHNSLTHWSHSSFIFRKEVASALGGWDEVRVGGDTEYIWRLKAHFGENSYKQVRDDIPLAFALDDESSLTRTKNTHVKTVYFGLRHIYREICAHRHRSKGTLQILKGNALQKVNIPLTMLHRDNRPIDIDILVITDFSDSASATQIYNYLMQQQETVRFGVFHWPDFRKKIHRLSDPYFEILQLGAIPVVSGETVEVAKVVVLDDALLGNILDNLPQITPSAEFHIISATTDQEKAEQIVSKAFSGVTAVQVKKSIDLVLSL